MRTAIALRWLLPLAACATAAAKEPTRKLLIDGGDLAGVVEITDSATLALSNVYAGNFLDPTRAPGAPSADLPRYRVSFFLRDDRGGALRRVFGRPRLFRAYVVYLVPDTAHHTSYVLVPGAGDPWGSWNHGVIIRAGREGRWSLASPAWGHRLADAIAHARRRPAPRCSTAEGATLRPRDAAFEDVRTLTAILEAHGLHVLCAYRTTFEGTVGVRRAAGVMTNLGPFAVLFFPTPAGAEAVRVTGTVKDGEIVTVLRGPDPRQRPDSLYGAAPDDIITHGRWLFDTWNQPALRAALASAIREY